MKQSFFPLFAIIILFAAALNSSCNSNSTESNASKSKDSSVAFNPAAMSQQINEKNEAFAKAFTTGDSAAMVNHYTTDGKIFAPNTDMVSGQPAIAALISEYLKFGIKKFHDSTTALYGTEDNLVEEGTFFMGDEKGNTIEKGKYLCVWRKVNNDWKVYSDIFNSSLPIPPAK